MTNTLDPKPPHNYRLFNVMCWTVLILFWMLAVSGCSTSPVKALWTPPQATLVKSEPLPTLPVAPDAKPEDPTTIGLAELAEDSLVITRMYRALAKRHDSLVDAVMEHLRNQVK